MNWRRGLVLAGIHLMVAVPTILILDARDAETVQERSQIQAPQNGDPASKVAPSEGETVTFNVDACSMISDPPPIERIPPIANPFAVMFSGWRQDCPARWSVAGRLMPNYLWVPTPRGLRDRHRVDLAFAGFIPPQWFLVGSFTLVRVRRWWTEPGAFITLCTVIAFVLVLIPALSEVALVPALFAGCAWFLWFGILIFKPFHSIWRWLRRHSVPPQTPA